MNVVSEKLLYMSRQYILQFLEQFISKDFLCFDFFNFWSFDIFLVAFEMFF